MTGSEDPSPCCQYVLKQLDGPAVLSRGVVAVCQAALAAEGCGMVWAQLLASSLEIRLEKAQCLLEPPRGSTGMGQPVSRVNAPAVVDSQARLQIFERGSQEFQLVLAGVVVAPIHNSTRLCSNTWPVPTQYSNSHQMRLAAACQHQAF